MALLLSSFKLKKDNSSKSTLEPLVPSSLIPETIDFLLDSSFLRIWWCPFLTVVVLGCIEECGFGVAFCILLAMILRAISQKDKTMHHHIHHSHPMVHLFLLRHPYSPMVHLFLLSHHRHLLSPLVHLLNQMSAWIAWVNALVPYQSTL